MSMFASRPWREGATQKVTYTGTAGTSTAFGSTTQVVRVSVDSAAHILVSKAGTAAQTSDPFLPANTVEYILVVPGESISVIRAASDGLVTATSGTLWVTELS